MNETHKKQESHGEVNTSDANGSKRSMLVVFQLEGEFFALPVEYAKEVVKTSRISPVPQASGFIAGVANIRGEVLAILDLRLLLGLEQTVHTEYPNLLVVKWKNKKMAFRIAEVPKTWSINEHEIQSTANMAWSDEDNQLIKGLIKREDQMVMILDLERIFEKE